MDAEGLIDWAARVLGDADALDHWQKDRERIDAEDLLAHVLGHDFDLDDDISLSAQARFEKLVVRRATGEPTQLIKGYTEFRGLKLLQKPGTFIPRDSTEFLAAQAIRRVQGRKCPVVVDMACGIGPVALAVKHEVPRARVYGADLSAEAIRDARANARKLGIRAELVG